jgi:hypothetical protein
MNPLLLIIASVCLLAGPVTARPMKTWKPAELLESAELVVVGKITEVISTEEESTINLGGSNAPIPVTRYSATVQPVAIIKGEDTPKELTVSYTNIDYEKLDPPVQVNGPQRVFLIQDQLFRLYLKKGPAGNYVGALDGDFDDGPAVKILNPDPRPTPKSNP